MYIVIQSFSLDFSAISVQQKLHAFFTLKLLLSSVFYTPYMNIQIVNCYIQLL